MNFEKFRRTGELSDITVIVDKTEFKLHTFPLFTKSDFFKHELAETRATTPYVIRLDNNFPGGAQTFSLLADYLYSIPISIDQKNVVALRSAAAFIKCDELAALLDKRLDELLRMAKLRVDLSIPLALLENCTGEYQSWAKEAGTVDKCIQAMIDALLRGAGSQLNKSDREMIVRLPVEWILLLIETCPAESKFAAVPIAKYYLGILVFEQIPSSSSSLNGQSENEHASAFTPVARKDEITMLSIDEKRSILEQIIKALEQCLSQMTLSWLQTAYEKAVSLDCECQSILSTYITQSLINSTNLDDGMENLPDHVMASLLERISKHKDDHAKDPNVAAKLEVLVDNYVEQLRQRGELTSEQFIKLATCIPKEKRVSHDTLLVALNEMLSDEKSAKMTENERSELLSHIDFSRINEDTINTCKDNKLIPQKLITEAALSLCVKLRQELDQVRTRVRVPDYETGRARPTYSSSSYRSRTHESTTRNPTSGSRLAFPSSYELPFTGSYSSYSRYDNDLDFDYLLRSRYYASSLGRYGSSYYGSRY